MRIQPPLVNVPLPVGRRQENCPIQDEPERGGQHKMILKASRTGVIFFADAFLSPLQRDEMVASEDFDPALVIVGALAQRLLVMAPTPRTSRKK